jgi:hypothetical protein
MAEARAEGSGVSKKTKPAGSLTRGAGRGSPRLGSPPRRSLYPGTRLSDPRSMFLHRAEACVGPVRVQGCGHASTAPTPSLLVTVCAPSGPAVQSPCSGGFALKGVPMSILDSGSSRLTSAEIIERANRSIEEATAQCKRIEAWLAEREAPERRQSFTLIQGGRGESDDA